MASSFSFSGETPVRLPLAQDGTAACTVVVLSADEPTWLLRTGADSLRKTVSAWSDATLPQSFTKPEGFGWPTQPSVVLATFDALAAAAPELASGPSPLARAAFTADAGFVCAPVYIASATHVVVTGKTARGVYNGAIYLQEFCIDGNRNDLYVELGPVLRTPQLEGRAVYLLTIWGNEAEYTAADWEQVFDSFARDGFDRVYFWLSGHFPSQQFPATFRCKDGPWDTTEKSAIPSLDDHRRLIRAAHDRGLRFYLGGGLGGWCGTQYLTDQAPGTMKTRPPGIGYEGIYSLCPSHPRSRASLIAYYKEMFDALPQADGLFIESADEWGACECALCSQPVDAFGSRQFGQSQLSLLEEILHAVWRDHPHARLAYTIGYDEHLHDPAYYARVRAMADPRIEWMEARDKWTFPGAEGTDEPAASFSRQVMRWRQYYALPLEQLCRDADRVARSGLYGLITAFEPGAGSGSVYTTIPYPSDLFPYLLTGFVWREATWEPTGSLDRTKAKVQRRFFGREAPNSLSDDLWSLRDCSLRAVSENTHRADVLRQLEEIEARATKARAGASPKTEHTLRLMQRCIDDLRAYIAR